ncbi:MAG TPA: hypothetical protein VJT72_12830 [Pseudonocardiaceae bacterium]|nr:hypothetical protein [Pseudonocardiaceae bacterium]
MALYTPQAQRRRRLVILAVATFLFGGVLGVFAGRLTAPTVADQVTQVRGQAQQMSAQLRVLSLHVEAGAVSLGAGGDAGAALALQRADSDLTRALQQAPWITTQQGDVLRTHLDELERMSRADAGTESFATNVDRLANEIDTTFGLTPAA